MKYPFVIYGMVMKLASKLVVGARTRTSYFSFHYLAMILLDRTEI